MKKKQKKKKIENMVATKKVVTIEKRFVRRVQKYLRLLSWIPFLNGVYVCNNVAFGVYDEAGDIDLFIVARKNRLFIVRTLVTLVLQLAGVRRHGEKIANRFCLSFFIDESFVNFEKIAIKDDIYLAFWIANLKPVFDDGFLSFFLEKNLWINEFVSKFDDFAMFNGVENSHEMGVNVKNMAKKSNKAYANRSVTRKTELFLLKRNFISNSFKGIFEILMFAPIGYFLDGVFSFLQLKRARKKAAKLGSSSSIILQRNILKFHNVDMRKKFRDKFYVL